MSAPAMPPPARVPTLTEVVAQAPAVTPESALERPVAPTDDAGMDLQRLIEQQLNEAFARMLPGLVAQVAAQLAETLAPPPQDEA